MKQFLSACLAVLLLAVLLVLRRKPPMPPI